MEGATADRVTPQVRVVRLAPDVAWALAVALLTWPVLQLQSGLFGDWNWVATLAYAAEHGLHYGEQIVWTYGPLGFLNNPFGPVLYYDDITLLSWLFTALIQVVLAGTLLVALRRSFPLAAALAVAFVALTFLVDLMAALGFAWCALVVSRSDDLPRDQATMAFPSAMGVLTGIAILGKLNDGIELILLASIALVVAFRARDAAVFAGVTLATALAGWLATGQALADVGSYVRNSIEIVVGYTAAMGLDDPAYAWAYPFGLALAALALALGWDATRGVRPLRRWGLVALCAVYVACGFKEAFVRQGPGHLISYFSGMLVLFAVLPERRLRRLIPVGGIAAGVVAITLIGGVHDTLSSANPYASTTAFGTQIQTLTSRARRDASTRELRRGIAAAYAMPDAVVSLVGRRSVMFWPSLEAQLAFAYGLDLRPLPTLEPYSAYTPALDRLGAAMLASSSRAPARIVRLAPEPGSAIDGRNPRFEAPLATLEILCRYRELWHERMWQLLARGTDRCGTPRIRATVSAPWGTSIAVPELHHADALMLVRVDGAGARGFERLKTVLLRPDPRWITLDETRFRLVPATAADGLLLRVPHAADYDGGFAMATNPSRIAVRRAGEQPGGRLRYTFVEMPIAPLPRADGG